MNPEDAEQAGGTVGAQAVMHSAAPDDIPDPRYEQARSELLSPPPLQTTSLLFIALFSFFVLSQLDGLKSLPRIATLVGVLLFHEGGHWAAMRVFGYRDVRVFFIPFLGAATSGRARGVAGWKEAVVSLMGPVPGIIAGAVVFRLGVTRAN